MEGGREGAGVEGSGLVEVEVARCVAGREAGGTCERRFCAHGDGALETRAESHRSVTRIDARPARREMG